MVGRADEDGVHVLPSQDFLVLLGREGLGVGEFLAFVEVFVVDVADADDTDVGHGSERLHEGATAAAGADAGDVEGFVSAEDVGGRGSEDDCAGRRGGLEEGAPGERWGESHR